MTEIGKSHPSLSHAKKLRIIQISIRYTRSTARLLVVAWCAGFDLIGAARMGRLDSCVKRKSQLEATSSHLGSMWCYVDSASPFHPTRTGSADRYILFTMFT